MRTPWQNRLESSVTIEPSSWHYDYTDYWGTYVRVFEANSGHRHLDVRASSVVEIDPSRRPGAAELSWTDVRDHTVRDEFAEYLVQTPATAPPTELADLADSIVADNPPAQAAKLISAAVHDALTYRPGVTEVETPAADAWAARSGVCQDYAHLVVGALRAAGMPARYVSGYLYPAVGPEVGASAIGESHAWVEWWLGEWTAYDPTNAAEVGERHIIIGTGRAYSDVPPIKGIVAGPHRTTNLAVTVELTRLA
jgi:transglutaminase-like putative cysteine protease